MKSSARKPYNHEKGYVTMRGCSRVNDGHVVIYDREDGYEGPGTQRYVLVHKATGMYREFTALPPARGAMDEWARRPPIHKDIS